MPTGINNIDRGYLQLYMEQTDDIRSLSALLAAASSDFQGSRESHLFDLALNSLSTDASYRLSASEKLIPVVNHLQNSL